MNSIQIAKKLIIYCSFQDLVTRLVLASTKFFKKKLSAKTNIKTSKTEPAWVRRVSLQVPMTKTSLQHYVKL